MIADEPYIIDLTSLRKEVDSRDRQEHNQDDSLNFNSDPEKFIKKILQEYKALELALQEKENELKTARAQLAQAGKLATLGTMGAGVAHELNNPLTVISAEADELMDAITGGYENKDLTVVSARNIKDCAERMRFIIDHIRKYTRKDNDTPWSKLNINDPIKDSLIILKSQLENSGIDIKLSLANKLPKIWGHANKLESVFQNLIANAKDAFKSINDGRTKQISISSANENRCHIVVKISDNACGMSEKVKSNIFDPFFTTKEIGSGTGLGLSIALSHVKEHKGIILLQSKQNEGTEFTLKFPLERRKTGES